MNETSIKLKLAFHCDLKKKDKIATLKQRNATNLNAMIRCNGINKSGTVGRESSVYSAKPISPHERAILWDKSNSEVLPAVWMHCLQFIAVGFYDYRDKTVFCECLRIALYSEFK